jgi:hypothetical protein
MIHLKRGVACLWLNHIKRSKGHSPLPPSMPLPTGLRDRCKGQPDQWVGSRLLPRLLPDGLA